MSEIRTWLGEFHFFSLKKVIFFEKYPQSQCHISVSQATDERIQYGGDQCAKHKSNEILVMGLA